MAVLPTALFQVFNGIDVMGNIGCHVSCIENMLYACTKLCWVFLTVKVGNPLEIMFISIFVGNETTSFDRLPHPCNLPHPYTCEDFILSITFGCKVHTWILLVLNLHHFGANRCIRWRTLEYKLKIGKLTNIFVICRFHIFIKLVTAIISKLETKQTSLESFFCDWGNLQ